MAFPSGLKNEDGAPVDPPTPHTAVPNWRAGDTIPLGRRTLRVVGVKDQDPDQAPTYGRRGHGRMSVLAKTLPDAE